MKGLKGSADEGGVRVPFLVVSPFAKKHHVSHEIYDHTSILRFIQAACSASPTPSAACLQAGAARWKTLRRVPMCLGGGASLSEELGNDPYLSVRLVLRSPGRRKMWTLPSPRAALLLEL